MKKVLITAVILTLISTFVIFKVILFVDKKINKESNITAQLQQEEKTEEKQDENTQTDNREENTETTTSVPEQSQENNIKDQEGVFKMLDFDRRLILNVGQQDEETCSIFCLAYARAILDNSFNVNPYDYWDDGAVWRDADFTDIAETDPVDKVLKKAYEQLDKGRPVIIYTIGDYGTTPNEKPQIRTASEHFVLLIGFKANADFNKLKASDFYGVDPAAGYKYSEDNYMPWVILTDNAPQQMQNEYALFAPSDENIHVKTCYAYADSVKWDTVSNVPIYPNYVQ